MARIRTIKPGFFKSEDVSVLPFRARLTWIGLWTHCDDAGRAKDNVRLIKAEIWPLDDVSLRDIEEDLSTLAAHGRIVRYGVDGQRFLEVTNWSEHQKIDRPTPSRIPPAPDGTAPAEHCVSEPRGTGSSSGHSADVRRGLNEDSMSARDRKGKEGKGREGTRAHAREPPPRCPEHLEEPDPPPCGRCGNARRANAAWLAGKAERERTIPKCPKHRGMFAHNCPSCRSERIELTEETLT